MSSLKNDYCLDRPLLLDGGLGMQLIHDGYEDIKTSPLWSAELVYSDPEAIESTHLKFLEAGAEIIETATYQMSFEGFTRHLNLLPNQTEHYFEMAVQLAKDAIKKNGEKYAYSRRILVAGSVGPYGAVLADRSEYSGAYWGTTDIRQKVLNEQRLRIAALIRAGVDLIAIETLPSTQEAEVFVELMTSPEFRGTPFYLSLVTPNGTTTPRGENLLDFLKNLTQKLDMDVFFGFGLNCSSIEAISHFIVDVLSNNLPYLHPKLKFLFYPNLDEPLKVANHSERVEFWRSKLSPWLKCLGKSKIYAIGGCCNVISDDIFAISQIISS